MMLAVTCTARPITENTPPLIGPSDGVARVETLTIRLM